MRILILIGMGLFAAAVQGYLVHGRIKEKSFHWFVVLMYAYEVVSLAAFSISYSDQDTEQYLLAGLLLIVVTLHCHLYFSVRRETKGVKEAERKAVQVIEHAKMQQEYGDMTAQYLKEADAVRRQQLEKLDDIRKRILEGKKTNQLQELLADSEEEVRNTRFNHYSEYSILNAVLVAKKRVADSKQIEMKIHLNIFTSFEMEDIDLCSLLGNLLDNAIEAAEKCKGSKVPPYVEINIQKKEKILLIQVENVSREGSIPSGKTAITTSKQDKENHGYGLMVIRSIVEKYQGEFRMEQKGQIVNCLVMIQEKES